MAVTNESNSLVKKDVPKSRYNPQVSKRIAFAHQITSGQVGLNVIAIDLKNLNTPAEMSSLGFVQATQSEINGAYLGTAKKNLQLSSTLKGKLFPNKHYVVVDNYTINLIGDLASAIEVDEIIYGEIDSQIGDLVPASVRGRVVTATVLAGQRTVNLGQEFPVGSNPNDRVGDIRVFSRSGSVLYRNTGNSSTNLDGDYYEVDSGNGYGTTIVLNSAPTFIPLELVIDYGPVSITNMDSLGTLQSIMGGMIKIAKDLASLVGGSQTDYLSSAPSDIERRTFGDWVLDLRSRFDTTLKLSEYTKTKFQVKALPSNQSTSVVDIAALRFNNLSVGKKYRITINHRSEGTNASAGSIEFLNNGASVAASYYSHTGNANAGISFSAVSSPFVATSPLLTANLTITGSHVFYGLLTKVTLEELPNHEQTADWT